MRGLEVGPAWFLVCQAKSVNVCIVCAIFVQGGDHHVVHHEDHVHHGHHPRRRGTTQHTSVSPLQTLPRPLLELMALTCCVPSLLVCVPLGAEPVCRGAGGAVVLLGGAAPHHGGGGRVDPLLPHALGTPRRACHGHLCTRHRQHVTGTWAHPSSNTVIDKRRCTEVLVRLYVCVCVCVCR